MNKVKLVIGKASFEFYFGLGFFGDLKDNQGVGIEAVQKGLQENPFKLVPILMLESAKYSAKRRGLDLKYTVYDFIDALDNDGGIASPAFIGFMEALTNSMTKDVPNDKKATTKKKEKALK